MTRIDEHHICVCSIVSAEKICSHPIDPPTQRGGAQAFESEAGNKLYNLLDTELSTKVVIFSFGAASRGASPITLGRLSHIYLKVPT